MKYFIDTEFLEGKQDKTILGIKYGETKPTIDLISIGIVSDDERKYYAISKEFNLKEAWNRHDLVSMSNKGGIGDTPTQKKVYWIRENVLKPIFDDLRNRFWKEPDYLGISDLKFSYDSLKFLIKIYGKTNKQIADDMKIFCKSKHILPEIDKSLSETKVENPEFYAYYADYDWVAFCWLFGKMIDLPTGFPKYCIDLKQELDSIIKKSWEDVKIGAYVHIGIDDIKKLPNYPKQTNEHNALADAKWNKELYKFIKTL